MAICDWPENERPREKLLNLGPQALSDAELLAIFLRVGNTWKNLSGPCPRPHQSLWQLEERTHY